MPWLSSNRRGAGATIYPGAMRRVTPARGDDASGGVLNHPEESPYDRNQHRRDEDRDHPVGAAEPEVADGGDDGRQRSSASARGGPLTRNGARPGTPGSAGLRPLERHLEHLVDALDEGEPHLSEEA